MTNEKQEEAGPVTVQIGVCSVCHALFMLSGDRLTSPCHGADPLAVLATLTIGPDAQVTGEWGMGSDLATAEVGEEPAPAPAPPEESPAEEEEEGEPPGGVGAYHGVTFAIENYLFKGEGGPDEIRQALLHAGAEPEPAAVCVGRLEAVSAYMDALSAQCHGVPVAPAPPEAESSPENT